MLQIRSIPATKEVGKERFLSGRRTSLPDIDLDVESERRLEVYDAIIERFGRERTAVTGMPETYRAWHALRFPVNSYMLRRNPLVARCPAQADRDVKPRTTERILCRAA